MQTLLLNPSDVRENARMPEVIAAVEEAFAAYQRGDTQMPAKSYIDLPAYNGDFRSMPAYMNAGTWDAAGIKWVNVHTDNVERYDLPTVLGTMIYSDPRNAFPLAIMDGTTLTRLRTGAAAAVATEHLAVPDERRVRPETDPQHDGDDRQERRHLEPLPDCAEDGDGVAGFGARLRGALVALTTVTHCHHEPRKRQ